jgi:hypothetical protein
MSNPDKKTPRTCAAASNDRAVAVFGRGEEGPRPRERLIET